MANDHGVLLEFWKTAGQEDRLEDACPLLLSSARIWGEIKRLLIVRWEPELGFLEPLVDFSANKNDTAPRKQNCEPGIIAELNRLFDAQIAVKIDDITQVPPQFFDLFPMSETLQTQSQQTPMQVPMPLPLRHSLWLGRLNPDKGVEALVFLELQSHREQAANINAAMQKNQTAGCDAKKSPASNDDTAGFYAFFSECVPLLTAVLRRELKIRRLNQRREAIEAEKDAVLAKFGRQDINSETIVGADRGLKRVSERIDTIAATGTPVLLIGETGSGKALVARSIHNRSGRASLPFVRFNCAAVSPERLESQLFGAESGVFERVGGGTIFLNDVHMLTTAAQSRLLTLLDRGLIKHPGTSQARMIDVRVIVATDRDLGAGVADSKFNEELWYRLAPFPIRLPALRERLGDLPELATHFARRAASRFGLPVVLPTERDIEFLKTYSWPGNVRELGTVIDRAALLGNGKSLDVATALGVPNDAISSTDWHADQQRISQRNRWAAFQEVEPFDDLVRRYLEFVLGITNGKIEGPTGAASLLNVNPNTLRSKLKKLGMKSSLFKK